MKLGFLVVVPLCLSVLPKCQPSVLDVYQGVLIANQDGSALCMELWLYITLGE